MDSPPTTDGARDGSGDSESMNVAKGTLRAVIREAGLTVDEFKALL